MHPFLRRNEPFLALIPDYCGPGAGVAVRTRKGNWRVEYKFTLTHEELLADHPNAQFISQDQLIAVMLRGGEPERE